MGSAVRPFVLSLVCCCVVAPAAAASTLNVTSNADGGAGTLRAALTTANPGDTITFPNGPMTITLNSALPVTTAVDIEGCSANPNATAPCVAVVGAPGFDALDVSGAGATIDGLSISGAAIGVNVSASNVTVGGPSPATADTISGSAGAAIHVAATATGVAIENDLGQNNGGEFIELDGGADGGAQPPTIVAASSTAVSGLAPPGATVRLFASHAPGAIDGVAGVATADATGVWTISGGAAQGEVLAATQSGSNGSSALSGEVTAGAGAGTAPTVTIAGPSGSAQTTTPAFTLTASDSAATVLCRIDGASYQTCDANFTPSALPEGRHTLYARAAGAGGLGPEVSQPFEINLAHPGTIVSGPPRFGRSSIVVFRFTVPAGTSKTECAVDNAPPKPCKASFTSGHLLDGRHVFHLTTTDAAGESAVRDTIFTVDTLAPHISLVHNRFRITGGRATIVVACPASEPGGCSGSVRIGTLPARKTRRFRAIGSATWKAGPQAVAHVGVRIPTWAVPKGRKGVTVQVVVVARDDAGNVTTLRRTVTLLAPD